MQLLFAHHDMLEVLDVLGFKPVTPLGHVLTFTVYGLLAFGLIAGLHRAGRSLFRWSRSTSGVIGSTAHLQTPEV